MSQTIQTILDESAQSLGGFELIARAGEGSTGIVFKARQNDLDRVVAWKVLRRELAEKDPTFVERLLREARASARLSHPNIVNAISVGQDEKTFLYYFAMEWVDGVSLSRLLDEHHRLDELRALKMMLPIAEALACAHRAGIIHRDVKPDNILLTQAGVPKLADLGLAKAAPQTAADATLGANLTQYGAAVGTPYYMAPEQIGGDPRAVDARADLYAFGATLFHMLVGRPPYCAPTSKEIMDLHATAPIPDARKAHKALSVETSRLLTRLLQKSPEKRVQTAEELCGTIKRILERPARVPSSGQLRAVAVGADARGKRPVALRLRPRRRVPQKPASRALSVSLLVGAAAAMIVLLLLLAGSRRARVETERQYSARQCPKLSAGVAMTGSHSIGPAKGTSRAAAIGNAVRRN